jgi:hypothetical protein
MDNSLYENIPSTTKATIIMVAKTGCFTDKSDKIMIQFLQLQTRPHGRRREPGVGPRQTWNAAPLYYANKLLE